MSDVDIVVPAYVGGQPQFPVADTVFTNIFITATARAGTPSTPSPASPSGSTSCRSRGRGPARGSGTFINRESAEWSSRHPAPQHRRSHIATPKTFAVLPRVTVVPELMTAALGRRPTMGEFVGNRAVVLGGGMAGLLTARVLSESYEDVVIVDRDTLSGAEGPRRGVPHGRHAHGLLARGQQILEELFPGLERELVGHGVPSGDLAGDIRWYFEGRPFAPARSGLLSVSATRPELEAHLRARVLRIPNVTLWERWSVDRLDFTHHQVTGVWVTSTDGNQKLLSADLVVDATGRGSRTPAWLEEHGYERPEEEKVKVDLQYTTRIFRLDTDPYGTDLSINPLATPTNPRGAFFPKLSDGTSLLSLTGMIGDYPPTDLPGFLEFAKTVGAPEIYDSVKNAEPVDDAATFRFPASTRRRYERLRRFPAGLLVLGDGVCSFNPVYGQGMTVAAMEAHALRQHIRDVGTPQALRFYHDISSIVDVPWDISAGADLGFPGVAGRRSLKTRIGNVYMPRLQAAAHDDPRLTEAFFRVAGLIDPPQTLTKPGVVMRVLRNKKVNTVSTRREGAATPASAYRRDQAAPPSSPGDRAA
ncbi:FAD-dependent monooxygenase [Amycolatopsis sp. NPDC024027]|uniref:FAD-dependent oxidoreductase n=1 Tax=Amycolatopsis sp. NPDC024027 TaxID=3154327 RepID=UPI0033C23A2D